MTKWLNPLRDLRRGLDSYYRCFFSLPDNIYIRGESKQCLEPGEPRALVISAFEKISTGVNKERELRPKADPGACKAQRKLLEVQRLCHYQSHQRQRHTAGAETGK